MVRKSMTHKARYSAQHSIAYDILAQEIIKTTGFQDLWEQLGMKLRQELTHNLVQQPLQQIGTSLGQTVQNSLSNDSNNSYALSEPQLGSLMQDLLQQAERIL